MRCASLAANQPWRKQLYPHRFILIGLVLVSTATAQPVYFADATLKSVVEQALGITDPTVADMQTLYGTLFAHEKGITDLTGLEYAVNLGSLWIYNNEITDLSPVASLTNLIYLYPAGNQVHDVSPLAGLARLERLGLENNQITDISSLAGLTNLVELGIENNQITDVSAVAGMTQLTRLSAHTNEIVDVTPVGSLTKLTYLNLSGNQVQDISALAGLTNLSTLDLRGNPLNAAACATYIPQIQANNPGINLLYDQCASQYYTLTLSSTWGGSITTPSEGAYQCDQNSTVAVSAAPDPGYEFTHWSGTAVDAGKVDDPSSASTSVFVDTDYTLQANFSASSVQHTLTISSTEGGSVEPSEGTYQYAHGTTVQLTATANSTYAFSHWSGSLWSSSNPLTVTLTSDLNVRANFISNATPQHTLLISSTTGGTVSQPGEGNLQYPEGTVVTIVAVADAGFSFSVWTGTAVDSGKVASPSTASTTLT
ncbi:MAG: leucine-rich repeat domain-containing protein, partial [Sedimentisphaerales bacterium]|nr:leucine-rich repeat domain-containing protein [Sedimentisphaerales bacterium]